MRLDQLREILAEVVAVAPDRGRIQVLRTAEHGEGIGKREDQLADFALGPKSLQPVLEAFLPRIAREHAAAHARVAGQIPDAGHRLAGLKIVRNNQVKLPLDRVAKRVVLKGGKRLLENANGHFKQPSTSL